MSIDFHAHLAREDPKAPPFMRDLFDVEGYLEKQERAGIERTVLSFALEDAGESTDEIKGEHDFLAGLLEQYPDRFSALAAVDPFGGADALAEGERALELGFTGFCFPTSRGGRYLDSARGGRTPSRSRTRRECSSSSTRRLLRSSRSAPGTGSSMRGWAGRTTPASASPACCWPTRSPAIRTSAWSWPTPGGRSRC